MEVAELELTELDSDPFDDASADIHGAYRRGSIHHTPPDDFTSHAANERALRIHKLRFKLFVTSELACLLLLILGPLVQLSTGSDNFAFLVGWTGFLVIVMPTIVFVWVLSLFISTREIVSEYGVLLEGRASAESFVIEGITSDAQRRGVPLVISAVKAGRQPLLLAQDDKSCPMLQGEPISYAAVAVRAYGSDLYVGWSIWRQRSTVQVLYQILSDALGESYEDMKRVSGLRAFRELTHSLMRDGVYRAISKSEDEARLRQS